MTDALALVAYLHRFFDVRIQVRDDGSTNRITTMTPTTGATVQVTCSQDSVTLRAGQLFVEHFPSCGCDACDSPAESAAIDLEEVMFAVVGGGLREQFPVGRRRWTRVEVDDGHGGGSSSSGSLGADADAHAVATALVALEDGWWPAWTLRGVDPMGVD